LGLDLRVQIAIWILAAAAIRMSVNETEEDDDASPMRYLPSFCGPWILHCVSAWAQKAIKRGEAEYICWLVAPAPICMMVMKYGTVIRVQQGFNVARTVVAGPSSYSWGFNGHVAAAWLFALHMVSLRLSG